MRLAVAATAPLGADVLRRLAQRHDIAYVLTRPDRPKGRGRRVGAPPAKEVAEELGIEVRQPERVAELGDPGVDVVVAAAYGALIPRELLDPGPIGAVAQFPIGPDDDAGVVFERAVDLGSELTDSVLALQRFTPQEGEATYAEKISPADRELDWSRPPEELHNRIRALSPHIGARGELHGRPVIVWRSRLDDGRLEVLEVQPEGGRRMTLEEFERGLRG